MTDDTPDRRPSRPQLPTRCGFVALIGAPNVGKSTLVNALVGSKVTIVSRKVQTTRALIRGIVIEKKRQMVVLFCSSTHRIAEWSGECALCAC